MVLWKKHWVAFSSFSFLKAYQHIEPLVALSYVRRYFPGATGFFGSWLGVTGTRYFSMREILSLRPLNRLWDGAMCQELGGGFNIFFCSPLLGIFPFWLIFFKGVGSTNNGEWWVSTHVAQKVGLLGSYWTDQVFLVRCGETNGFSPNKGWFSGCVTFCLGVGDVHINESQKRLYKNWAPDPVTLR